MFPSAGLKDALMAGMADKRGASAPSESQDPQGTDDMTCPTCGASCKQIEAAAGGQKDDA